MLDMLFTKLEASYEDMVSIRNYPFRNMKRQNISNPFTKN
jgi:hypothetical protein